MLDLLCHTRNQKHTEKIIRIEAIGVYREIQHISHDPLRGVKIIRIVSVNPHPSFLLS